ncbi:MAG: DUF1028 domain-containing protein [Pseudomonadota bacterium]
MGLIRLVGRVALCACLAVSCAEALPGRDTEAQAADGTAPPISTFSIVAYDPESNAYGVAVQSKFFSVGSVVPFAEAGTGALATQAIGNPLFGPRALELFREGVDAKTTLEKLLTNDPNRAFRQLGAVDSKGNPATFTGSKCLPWAGGQTGKHYAVQGNLLAGPQVLDAMAAAYEASRGDLATRLVRAISAGMGAGGDARGRESAAVLVVKSGAGYLGLDDRLVDLHVEDHPTPIRELQRLLDIRHGQLAAAEATSYLGQLAKAPGAEKDRLLTGASAAAERAVAINRASDANWWLAARTRLLTGDRPGALEAAQTALLLSPSWPRLPEPTRIQLGVDPALVEALREDDGFRRLWDALAIQAPVARQTTPLENTE